MKKTDLDLLFELVRTNFKLKYNDSILGFLWVLLKPFLMFLILYTVFSQVSRSAQQENFQVYLLLGIIMYTYFNESIVFGMNSLLDKAHIILKVNFNRPIAVLSNQILASINLTINLFVLLIFSVASDVNANAESIAYFFLILIILTLVTLGIAFFTSVIFVRFRDLLHLTELSLQLLFYASSIFFPISQVPGKMSFLFWNDIPVRGIFQLNPLYILIQAARDAIMLGEINFQKEVTMIGFLSFGLIILGYAYFNSKVKRVAEYF